MSIGVEGIRKLAEVATFEVIGRKRPIHEQLANIDLFFTNIRGSSFPVTSPERDDPLHGVYITPLGTIDITPQQGQMLIPQDGAAPKWVSFFRNADDTLSIVSATVRFVMRWAAHVKQHIELGTCPAGIRSLAEAASFEITSRNESFEEQLADINLFFNLAQEHPESKFRATLIEKNASHAVYDTTLGIMDITPQQGKILTQRAGAAPEWMTFFSNADETASIVSATVRVVMRRSARVNPGTSSVNYLPWEP